MMKKKEVYTNITPLPSFIPRQLAVDLLHSHGEIIELNPLVIDYRAIKPPRDAPAEEYYSTWYEITERIQFIPGIGKMGAGKVSFHGCFHDVPWGLQTHIYVPMGIDLRHNYRIAGNQPGEPPERQEIGIGAPSEGLYLREDIEIRCNFSLVSFVKNNLKSATKVLVDRLIKKAELLDQGVLQAMMENGRLKTINPADRSAQAQAQRQQMLVLQQQQQQQQPPSPPLSSPSIYRVPRSPDPARSSWSGTATSDSTAPMAMELPGDMSFNHDHKRASYVAYRPPGVELTSGPSGQKVAELPAISEPRG
ncbi:hypothetical protein VTN31DRAFT_5406 [Thermomyces dupontii]|uniref:uncharacterized protein n=1 Tax=Talaromyces thermophilus TaxID=28565 RepID=UPI0037421908